MKKKAPKTTPLDQSIGLEKKRMGGWIIFVTVGYYRVSTTRASDSVYLADKNTFGNFLFCCKRSWLTIPFRMKIENMLYIGLVINQKTASI